MPKSKSFFSASHYNANYGNFQKELYADIRREAFGEDIGQNSWLTAGEQNSFLKWLNLSPGKILLDVACGSGGPALRIASITGCSLVGIDAHEDAILAAESLVAARNLTERARFQLGDASSPLPFPDAYFDAITCIDAINHLPQRPRIIAEWARLLKPRGRVLFSDPITLTGPLTNEEVSVRSAAGFYLLVPHGYDASVIAQCGLRLLVCEDTTPNMATVAQSRRSAREKRSADLREIEGGPAYEQQQEFLAVAARLAKEGRLSRFMYVAEKSE
jgi:ubiquinone/menaquinone biosynthesis C-methylase UbiE